MNETYLYIFGHLFRGLKTSELNKINICIERKIKKEKNVSDVFVIHTARKSQHLSHVEAASTWR